MLDGYGHSVWGQFFADAIHSDFDKTAVLNDYANIIIDEDGAVTNESLYVTSGNCTVEMGSLFAWFAAQSSAST